MRKENNRLYDTADKAKEAAEVYWQKKAREIIVNILDIPE